MILITTTSIVVVAFAITFRLRLVLMCKQELFGFQLKLLDLFADLRESLFSVLVVEVCHLWSVLVVMAMMLNRWTIDRNFSAFRGRAGWKQGACSRGLPDVHRRGCADVNTYRAQ